MQFEISAMNAGAMDKALVEKREELYALVSPEARHAFHEPHSARWHSGRFAVEFWTALITLGGKPMLEDFNYRMSKKSFGPVVGPLIRIGMTLSGSTAATMFAKIESLTSLALRGLTFDWKPSGPNGGVQTITYPIPVPADVMDAAWRGVYRVGAELMGKTVRIDRFEALSDRSCRFEVSW